MVGLVQILQKVLYVNLSNVQKKTETCLRVRAEKGKSERRMYAA